MEHVPTFGNSILWGERRATRYWCLNLILAFCIAILHTPCLATDPPLRLATLEYPPYITNTDRGAQGLAVDIVKTAFSRIGQSIKIEFYPIARGQSRLLSGEADGFFSIKKTPEREQHMLFSQIPLMSQDYVIFTHKGSSWRFTGTFDSLADARIGIVIATSYGSRFDSATQAGKFSKLDKVADHEANFRKLIARRVDAVICSRLVGFYYLKLLNGLNEVEVSGPPVETTVSYLAFTLKKDYTVLSRQFDKSLESMERDGTVRRLTKAYQLPQPVVPSR